MLSTGTLDMDTMPSTTTTTTTTTTAMPSTDGLSCCPVWTEATTATTITDTTVIATQAAVTPSLPVRAATTSRSEESLPPPRSISTEVVSGVDHHHHNNNNDNPAQLPPLTRRRSFGWNLLNATRHAARSMRGGTAHTQQQPSGVAEKKPSSSTSTATSTADVAAEDHNDYTDDHHYRGERPEKEAQPQSFRDSFSSKLSSLEFGGLTLSRYVSGRSP